MSSYDSPERVTGQCKWKSMMESDDDGSETRMPGKEVVRETVCVMCDESTAAAGRSTGNDWVSSIHEKAREGCPRTALSS